MAGDIIQYAYLNELYKLKIKKGEVEIISKKILKGVKHIVGIVNYEGQYFIADKYGYIVIYDKNLNKISSWKLNKQINSMTYHKDSQAEGLYMLDSLSRAIYVYELKGNQLFSITVPHEGATSIASIYNSQAKDPLLYISYVRKTCEIYDDTDPESSTGNYLNI